jgi:hypothetical protein
MGIKMSRADLDKLAGRKPQAVPAPPKQPEAPATAQLDHRMAVLSEQLAQNTAVMAHTAQVMANPPSPKQKKLEAIIHRDDKGRMARVEITVI